MHPGTTAVYLGHSGDFWGLFLLLPALTWVWHLGQAVRGRDRYPLPTFMLAVSSGLVVFGGLWMVGAIAYPRGYGIEHPFDRAFNALWGTSFLSLLASYAMVVLELGVALVWYVAREVRRSRNPGRSSPDSTEPPTAGASSRFPT
jgi:hypothetical protein